MNRFFHSELDTIKAHLMLMGEKALSAVYKSVKALEDFDVDLANEVMKNDDDIDALEIEIDREAMRYLTLRAPVASDLRLLTVAIKASHDLERVGDEARNIAKRTRKIIVKSGIKRPLLHITEMAEISQEMLNNALQGFFKEEPDMAKAVIEMDDKVDDLNKENLKNLIKQAKDESDELKDFLDMIFISKSLERIADHATNLAEEVIYLTTGKEARHLNIEDLV
jgi:phosphate transport system protein